MLQKYSRNTLKQFITSKGNIKGFQFNAIYYKNTNVLEQVVEWDGSHGNLTMNPEVFIDVILYGFEVKWSAQEYTWYKILENIIYLKIVSKIWLNKKCTKYNYREHEVLRYSWWVSNSRKFTYSFVSLDIEFTPTKYGQKMVIFSW